mmetsp:Transcript_35811/g.85595  ORF Transcript_35811/g.85595 Transcript_35811/m.85595 type:complete len:211 (+) Transcript_35811:3-635(+)
MKEAGVPQHELAGMLSRARAVWSSEELLGDQSARVGPLADVITIVRGLEDAPSPLYGETLSEVEEPVPVDDEFLAASARAADAVAQGCDKALARLEHQHAAVQRELEALLSEVDSESGSGGEEESRKATATKKIAGGTGKTVVVYEAKDPDLAEKRAARRKLEELEQLRENGEKLLRKKQLREEVEMEFAAFAAEEALLAEEERRKPRRP